MLGVSQLGIDNFFLCSLALFFNLCMFLSLWCWVSHTKVPIFWCPIIRGFFSTSMITYMLSMTLLLKQLTKINEVELFS